MSIVVPFSQSSGQTKPATPTLPPDVFLAMAAAHQHALGKLLESDPEPEAGMSTGPAMDITSQSQKADMQTKSNTWPEGTDPSVRKMFDDNLKSGAITRDVYNKAMRDPRQFQEDK